MNATSYFIIDEKEKIRYASISEGGPELSEDLVSYKQLYRQNGGILTVYGENHSKRFAAPHYLGDSVWIVYSLSEPVAVKAQLWDSVSQLLILAVLCFTFCFSLIRLFKEDEPDTGKYCRTHEAFGGSAVLRSGPGRRER